MRSLGCRTATTSTKLRLQGGTMFSHLKMTLETIFTFTAKTRNAIRMGELPPQLWINICLLTLILDGCASVSLPCLKGITTINVILLDDDVSPWTINSVREAVDEALVIDGSINYDDGRPTFASCSLRLRLKFIWL